LQLGRIVGGNVTMERGTERGLDLEQGNALKGDEPQECYRHETRPGQPAKEQGTVRLRKPESAAQSGAANPMQVAFAGQCAEGGKNPTGVRWFADL
jgi:hypothetical protein